MLEVEGDFNFAGSHSWKAEVPPHLELTQLYIYCLSIVYDKIGVNNVNFYSGLYNIDSGGDKVWSAVLVVAAESYEALGGGEVQHPLPLHIIRDTSSAI